MGKEIITFANIEVEKHKFYQYKSLISIYDVNIDKIVMSIRLLFVKWVLNILLTTKMLRKLDRYA